MASQGKLSVMFMVISLIGIVSVVAQDPNAKCRQPFSLDMDFAARYYDSVIVYNISSTKNVQSCVDFLESYGGPSKDNFTLAYTEGGVKYRRPGNAIYSLESQKGTLTYYDNPNEVIEFNVGIQTNGVYIISICNGNEQFTWIAYDVEKDLSKEAEEVAKTLTDTPADYKIARDGC